MDPGNHEIPGVDGTLSDCAEARPEQGYGRGRQIRRGADCSRLFYALVGWAPAIRWSWGRALVSRDDAGQSATGLRAYAWW